MSVCMEEDLKEIDIRALADLCAAELEQRRHQQTGEERFCLEMLRRATVEQVEQAWSALQQLFAGFVCSWLRKHPSYTTALLHESEENYIAQTFSRFWSATREQRLEFLSLPTALRYLHATLNSIIIDTLRVYTRARSVPLLDIDAAEEPVIEADEAYTAEELWSIMRNLLPDEHEQRLMYLLYYCGLKPREIVARFPETFPAVKEVYRLNHCILERLRRNRDRLRWLIG